MRGYAVYDKPGFRKIRLLGELGGIKLYVSGSDGLSVKQTHKFDGDDSGNSLRRDNMY
jgi:hypothetical protein